MLPASPDVPVGDALAVDFEKLALRYQPRVTLHRRPWTRMEMARAIVEIQGTRKVSDPTMLRLLERVRAALKPELEHLAGGSSYWKVHADPLVEVRLEAQVASKEGAGDPHPIHGGDGTGPFLALSDRVELGVGPVVAVVEPRFVVDPVGRGQEGLVPSFLPLVDAGVDVRRGYVKLHGPVLEFSLGIEDRAFGPGHYGLILSNNSEPPLTLRVRTPEAFRLPWVLRYLGAFAVETSWSRLALDRTDVEGPTLWTFFLTWLPLPWIELTLERAAIYGGEGRPPTTAANFWSLFWGILPHTSDDVAREEWDADEIASLDARVNLPFAPLIPGVQFVQLYWQYGGEDVITRPFLGVQAPALAGVGNLGGIYLGVGPFTGRFEAAVLKDDKFRWYNRHRIYHEGFHHQGRVMGHPMDGDSAIWGVYLDFDDGGPLGASAWFESIQREGVLDEIDGVVYRLPTPERRHRGGGEVRLRLSRPGPWEMAIRGQVEKVSGEGFVPGEDHTYAAFGMELKVPFSEWPLGSPRRQAVSPSLSESGAFMAHE